MSSTLTDQQRAAVDAAGVGVGLRAGAGCGKTTVLTETYLAALDARRPLAGLVALSFTQKAAQELRARVRAACRGRLAEGTDSRYWRGVLRDLEAAPIGTFHTYCTQILRRHPAEAAVPPGFVVLDEAIQPAALDASIDATFRRLLAARHPDLVAVAVADGVEATVDRVRTIVESRAKADLGAWSRLDPAALVDRWRDAARRLLAKRELDEVGRRLAACVEVLDANPCSHPKMNARIAVLRLAAVDLPGAADPGVALAALRESAKVQGGGTAAHWSSEEVYERAKKCLKELRDQIDESGSFFEDDTSAPEAAARCLALARLAEVAAADYQLAKARDGQLDYDDQLLKARDLLRDGPEAVREAEAARVDLLLVDEFQDTDPIQAEILRALCPGAAGLSKLFLVGDVKQSIYRFRRAEPRLFGEFRRKFPRSGRLALTENFRSDPGILDFVNHLFAETFTRRDDPLDAGPIAPMPGPAVTFLWPRADGPAEGVDEARLVEARWVARLVAERLRAGWPVRDRSGTRPATPGDVAILFSTLNGSPPYEMALAAEGLDYHVFKGKAYYAQQEVVDLINVLSAVEDPADALSLAGVLRSPYGNLSDAGLYWLTRHAEAGDLVDGFEGHRAVVELSPIDRERAGRLHALLERWRSIKDRVPIAELVASVLEDSGVDAAVLAEPLGDRRRANGRKLARLARRFDAAGGRSLGDFVARLRELARRPPAEEQAATTAEGSAIRLLTIHQAKGLEFPIVVVPDLDHAAGNRVEAAAVHPELGVLAPLPREEDDRGPRGLGWDLYRRIEKRGEEDERLRQLYVATTRARDHLILSAGVTSRNWAHSPAMGLLTSRFDIHRGEPLGDPPAGRSAPRVAVVDACPPAVGRPSVRSRPRRLALARAIERARPLPAAAPRPRPPARSIRLDPAADLSPWAAAVDRLIRHALADADTWSRDRLDAALARSARALAPSPPPKVVAEARARLGAWLGTALAGRIARATEVRRALDWSLAWPPGDPSSTAIHGRADVLFRDENGGWNLVQHADPGARDGVESLRLALSARAAAALGLGPIRRVWTCRLGISPSVVEVVIAADVEVGEMIAALCESVDR